MSIDHENIVTHLVSFGYTAKAGTLKDQATGEQQPVVFVNGLGSINAYLNLSDDPKKFGLKIFGNLQDGYAPVVLNDEGEPIRETVRVNGQPVSRAKRGEPLAADALKRKNNEISISARKEITAAVLAAYMLEAAGGDMEKIKAGFRLQKWERTTPKPELTAGSAPEAEVSAEVTQAPAVPETTGTKASTKFKRTTSSPRL